MKTIKKSIFAAALIFVTGSLFASGNLWVNMTQAGSEEAVIEASNVNAELFEIEVRDEYGELIFTKETKENAANYKKKYDFSALEDGRYYLQVKHGNETFEKYFQLERGDIQTLNTSKKIAPFFEFADNKWKMSYLNFSGDNMGIYIYGDKGLVHEKDLKPEFKVNEGFDLSKLESGNYKVVFTAGFDVYEKDITIE